MHLLHTSFFFWYQLISTHIRGTLVLLAEREPIVVPASIVATASLVLVALVAVLTAVVALAVSSLLVSTPSLAAQALNVV